MYVIVTIITMYVILYYYIKFLKREWLSNVVPIKLAIIALIISPGINVNDNKNAFTYRHMYNESHNDCSYNI